MAAVYEQVWEIVRKIPPGKVLTYGLISNLMASRLSAQGVGWALQALASSKSSKTVKAAKEKPVPWHRVVNARGATSTHKNPDIPPDLQRILLEKEGIVFGPDECLVLSDYLWLEGLNNHLVDDPARK